MSLGYFSANINNKMSVSKSKQKYGIVEFKDGFTSLRRHADEALINNNIDGFIEYNCNSVKKAIQELDEIKNLSNYSEDQLRYERMHRETFIVSRLVKLKYSQRVGLLGDMKSSDVSKIIRECLSGFETANHIPRLVSLKVKNKLLSNNENGLSTALANDENGHIECKKSFNLREGIAKTISAFANTDGGDLYIGIAEERDILSSDVADHIIGKFFAFGLPKDIDTNRSKMIDYISSNTDIDVSKLRIQLISFKSKMIMRIKIPAVFRSTGEVIFYKDDAYLRKDNYSQRLSARQVKELMISYKPKLRGIQDIRRIAIVDDNVNLKAVAFYSDGTADKGFKAYWFGWQIAGGSVVWTSLGDRSNAIKIPNKCSEIHAYIQPVSSDKPEATNLFGVWKPGL